MNKYTITSATLLIAFMLCIALQTSASSIEDTSLLRSRIVLPKIFNFELFKQLYKKSYGSVIENLARRRIYLAKSFRAFISMVFYKHRQSSSYLAINDMSDWTPEEIDKTFMDPNVALKGLELPRKDEKEKSNREVPVADLEGIKEELEEIVEHQSDEPNFKLIAEELVKNGDLNDLRADNLLGKTSSTITIASDNFLSNNIPNHQDSMLSADESFAIATEPESNFFKEMMQKISSAFKESEKSDRVEMDENEIYIDHRDCFIEPKNQYECGSCYAFSSISIYEWIHCKTTGKSVAFSEQYVIDCGREFYLFGCGGGRAEAVHEFVEKYGLELSGNYRYTAKEGICPFTSDEDSLGHLRVDTNGFRWIDAENLEKELKKSPILVVLNTNVDFIEYGGGVDDPKNCKKSFHSMAMVGSGREDGQDYWLIRNSHGVNWGERGYYKLSKKSTCSDTEYHYKLDNYKVIKAISEV